MRKFDTGATRNSDTNKLDFEGFLSPLVVQRFAEYMHSHRLQADGRMRDSDNWQKGIPRAAYIKSAWRHFFDIWWLWRGGEPPLDERGNRVDMEAALCALLFNVQGLLHEVILGRDAGVSIARESGQRLELGMDEKPEGDANGGAPLA